MNSRRISVFIGTLLLAIIGFWSYTESNRKSESTDQLNTQTALSLPAETSQQVPVTLNPAESKTSELKNIQLPKSQDIREQMLEDADHSTPEAILKFAEELAPHLEQALDSPESAAMVYQFLEQCVNAEDEVSESIKIMCMINAQRVSQKFPAQYQARSERLKSRLGQDSLKTVDSYFKQ